LRIRRPSPSPSPIFSERPPIAKKQRTTHIPVISDGSAGKLFLDQKRKLLQHLVLTGDGATMAFFLYHFYMLIIINSMR
jgi:hypothetical protein